MQLFFGEHVKNRTKHGDKGLGFGHWRFENLID
jgi:hypothetical protein